MYFVAARTMALGWYSCFIVVVKWEGIQRNFVTIYCKWTWVDVYVTQEGKNKSQK